MQNKLISFLSQFTTEERFNLFQKKVRQRTNYISVVLEDIYQSQNASAVLRTCDCFGIQNVHIIENRNKFTINHEVALGASKWLSLHKYNDKKDNSTHALEKLKRMGYRIVATSPHANDVELSDFDLSKGKIAIIFGSELQGITDTAKNQADEFLKIPMVGFTESFNISVSAAIILYHLTQQLKQKCKINWELTEQEKNKIILQWLRNSIKSSKLLEERFLKEQK